MGLRALTGGRVGSLDEDGEGWGRIRTPSHRGETSVPLRLRREMGVQNAEREK